MTKGDKRFLAALMMMLLWVLVHSMASDKDLSYYLYVLMIVVIWLYFFCKDFFLKYIQLYMERKRRIHSTAYITNDISNNEVVEAELM